MTTWTRPTCPTSDSPATPDRLGGIIHLVASAWEEPRQDADGRPPRKFYKLTDDGIRTARLELAEASMNATRPAGGTSTSGTRRRTPGEAR